jgi:hypothetical protein
MKRFALTLLIGAGAFGFSATLHSQRPAAPKSSMELLQEMKQRNQQMLEKQTQTIVTLEELQKAAQQIKALAART